MSEHDEEALPERETFIQIKDGEIAEGQVLADLDGAGESKLLQNYDSRPTLSSARSLSCEILLEQSHRKAMTRRS